VANDCWPVTSWAAVDGDGRRKPLFYALRHAHAARLVTAQPRGGALVAVLVNDTAEPWSEVVTVTRHDFDGVDPDAVVDDMLRSLLPGETVSWEVSSDLEVSPEAFLHPTVLRSANQLVHNRPEARRR
jgi:hypothetical protein